MIRMRIFFCLFLAAGLAFVSAPAWSQQRDAIDYALDWVIGGRHAAYFLALEKGYYREEGLDVKIRRGFGSADGIKLLVAGTVAYAFADVSSLVLAQAKEKVGVKSLAVIYSNAPHGLTFFSGKGIEKPRDLEGKKIAATAGSAIKALFPAFAKANGVNADKVEWVLTDAATLASLLAAGQIDAYISYPMDTAMAARRFAPMGLKVQGMLFKDYGLQFYSNGILVSSDRVRNNPEQVRKFVRASLRGHAESFLHPEEAVDLLLKTNPAVSREAAIPEVTIVRDLALSEEALLYGLGYMSRKKMEATRSLVMEAYQLKGELPLENLYTNEFLPSR
jgi:NitT/TauT family transport system substrate-binding protein